MNSRAPSSKPVTWATTATKLIRAFDFNQVLYNQGGFLADFKRAQSNLALSGNKSAAYNSAITGSQPLTLLPIYPRH